MALTIGNTVANTTTLATLIDSVFANKTGALTGAASTITAYDGQKMTVSWPGLGSGSDKIDIILVQRAFPPAAIAV